MTIANDRAIVVAVARVRAALDSLDALVRKHPELRQDGQRERLVSVLHELSSPEKPREGPRRAVS